MSLIRTVFKELHQTSYLLVLLLTKKVLEKGAYGLLPPTACEALHIP